MTYQPHQSEDATLKPVAPERPRCAVRGLIRPGAMCGSVIVGGVLCGFKGKCEHQRATAASSPNAKAAGRTVRLAAADGLSSAHLSPTGGRPLAGSSNAIVGQLTGADNRSASPPNGEAQRGDGNG